MVRNYKCKTYFDNKQQNIYDEILKELIDYC